ncbi:MAG: hypothetical protein E6K65_08020 [Nitrospirae bacterium]|nr:MAG: hypothetical protein E6K65_08020 [Nitrospirota bacterium]
MTEKETHIILAGLGVMESAVDTLTGDERRQVCRLMQELCDVTGQVWDLEASRQEILAEIVAAEAIAA